MNAPRASAFPAASAKLRWRAFTLLELLIVIGLIGLLTFVAVPAFKGFGQANTLAAAQRQLQDDLGLARQLAIKNRAPVYLVFFSPDPLALDSTNKEAATRIVELHNYLASLPASDFQERALRMFTNVFAGQHISYAFYSESRVGDQPVLAGSPASQRRGRYLSAGGGIWRTLPDGIIFPAGLRFSIGPVSLTAPITKRVPFPLAPQPGDPNVTPKDEQPLALPVIAFDALGRSMGVDASGQLTAQLQDQYVAIGYGSVFVPHDPVLTNNYDFNRLADVVETPSLNYTNTIFRVAGLTGRAKRFYWGSSTNQP